MPHTSKHNRSLTLRNMRDNKLNDPLLRPLLLKPSSAKESPTRMHVPRFPHFSTLRLRRSIALTAFAMLAALSAGPVRAQSTNPIQVLNASALHPPAGARVAIVEFDD